MRPASVLFGSGFVGSPAQRKIVVNQTVKAVTEKKVKKLPKKCRR